MKQSMNPSSDRVEDMNLVLKNRFVPDLIFITKPLAFLGLIILALTSNDYGQQSNEFSAKISTWYQNKPGAISISFDDASYTQYTSAYPILEKYDIKATFGIVGEWVEEEPVFKAETGFFEIQRMGWPQLIELHDHGHELAAHGFKHEKYDKLWPVSDLAEEMKKIKTLIESRTNSPVCTMNYPYSYASGNIPIAANEAGFLFGRTGLDTVNPASPENMYLLATQAILNESLPDSNTFRIWLDKANGNWLILMYHHLFEENSKETEIMRLHSVEYSYSIYPELFEKQVKEIVSTGYWIAPVCTIGKYITERNGTEVKMIRTRKKIYIYTFTNLNKNIYDQPLTLEVKLPWKRVGVKGSQQDGIVETHNNRLFIDVLPEKEIILTKE
jgi:peptidoglycan/xylan/chitin deacetylase (PgdA/CDA1 family)